MATRRQQLLSKARNVGRACADSASVFLRDTGNGLLEVGHNSLALIGLIVVAAAAFVAGQTDLRHSIETEAFGWLQARQDERTDPAELAATALAEPDAVSRATAAHPKDLTRKQAAVAMWISRRYRVAPEPVSKLVQEAWAVGPKVGVDPTLILAVIAIESRFNPFAQSPVGAQGLMQVMTSVHDEKYERYGGILAAFDPVANLKVGVQVLKECIQRAGSVEAGLRYYVGAGNRADDNGYANKVLAEQSFLNNVAGGKSVSSRIKMTTVVSVPAVPPAEATKPGDPAAVKVGADAQPQLVALAH